MRNLEIKVKVDNSGDIKSRLGFVFGVKMCRRVSRFTAGTIMIQ